MNVLRSISGYTLRRSLLGVVAVWSAAVLFPNWVCAQAPTTLDLVEAHRLAEKNYPTAGKVALAAEVSRLEQSRIDKGRLPNLSLNGQAQYQSANVNIGGDIPMSPIHIVVPLESYKGYVDLNYNIYSGGSIGAAKEVEISRAAVEGQQIEVSLDQLKSRINALFFAVLLTNEQKSIAALALQDLHANIGVLQAGYDHGAVLESDLLRLQVRELELRSDTGRMHGDMVGYYARLSSYIGMAVSGNTELVVAPVATAGSIIIQRPELQLYNARSRLLVAQGRLLNTSRIPKLSLYGQGGIGYPHPLNFTDISTNTYGLIGVRLNWALTDWGRTRQERKKLDLQRQQVELEAKAFEFDIRAQHEQFQQKVDALRAQITNDEEIVRMRQLIHEQGSAQLANGVIRASDFLTIMNDELNAQQQLELHRTQLLQTQVDFATLNGTL